MIWPRGNRPNGRPSRSGAASRCATRRISEAARASIANLTPFRGPSADVGTVYEVGFARALGLAIFGYATTTEAFLPRTLKALGGEAKARQDGTWHDGDGLLVEQFGLFDNLMIEGGIIGSGGELITGDAGRWDDLSLFERCVQAAAERLRA